MVKLTTKYLFRRISKKNQLQPKKKDESDLDYLNRITHLYLQSQFIDKISGIPECQSIKVVYLQNNLLRTIQNMDCFPSLTHLYLQHNFISKIENLDKLAALKKLYLGSNEIAVIEGLDKLANLTELHVENQRLPQGETIYFDPLTLAQLKHSLQVLNVSDNNMTSIVCLGALSSLTKLIIENNQISEMAEIMETLSQLPRLEILNCEANPVVSDRKFLDAVIVSSKSLKSLNGKQIDERTRTFVTNLAYNKQCRKSISDFSTRAFNSSDFLSGARKPVQSLNQLNPKVSSRFGSKLFPVLKTVLDKRQKNLKMPLTSKDTSSIYKNVLDVTHVSASASYHL